MAIEGEVVIAKHPLACMGDVRRVRAVGSCTLLSHHVNVVVFSQLGERPLPNMLSGSDLVSGV